jgi:hypothetical protein
MPMIVAGSGIDVEVGIDIKVLSKLEISFNSCLVEVLSMRFRGLWVERDFL